MRRSGTRWPPRNSRRWRASWIPPWPRTCRPTAANCATRRTCSDCAPAWSRPGCCLPWRFRRGERPLAVEEAFDLGQLFRGRTPRRMRVLPALFEQVPAVGQEPGGGRQFVDQRLAIAQPFGIAPGGADIALRILVESLQGAGRAKHIQPVLVDARVLRVR